ncbi:MAG: hypothetical protein WAQ98_18585 [Blastocatellia bacterium]
MQKITIQKEHMPKRCEICHQVDMLDGLSGTCQRCKDLSLTISQSNLAQVLDGKKKPLTAKIQMPLFAPYFVTYNLSEIIFFSFMITTIVFFVFLPEQIIDRGNIKYYFFCVGIAMAGYNLVFGDEQGQARAIRIGAMMVVYAMWDFFIRFLKEIN